MAFPLQHAVSRRSASAARGRVSLPSSSPLFRSLSVHTTAPAACATTARRFKHAWGPGETMGAKYEVETYEPAGDKAEFIKSIRKPLGLYTETIEAVKAELRGIDKVQTNEALAALLKDSERDAYLSSLMCNMNYPKAVHTYFDKSCFGLPLFGSTVYSHMYAGLGNYIMEKKGVSDIKDAMSITTYYRSPMMNEELYRLGYSEDQVKEIIAKQFFLQYWSGRKDPDPLVFNPMVRTFYPTDSHVGAGSTDLGRDTELMAARLFCMGHEGKEAPVSIINAGDTLFHTDGAMHALQHIVEAKERGGVDFRRKLGNLIPVAQFGLVGVVCVAWILQGEEW